MTEQVRARRKIQRAKWRCPSCDTLVPREHEQCRCGFLKTWRGAAPRRASPSSQFILLVAVAAVGALFTLWMLLR